MIKNKKLKYIKTINDLDLYVYFPMFGHWFYKDWDGFVEDYPKGIKRRLRNYLRYMLEWIGGGYKVYYAGQDETLLSYVLVAKGGRRITCSSKSDIVLGPYFTLTKERGKGIMPRLLDSVLNHLDIQYDNAFCYISKKNIASIKSASKSGFKIIGEAELKGPLRKVCLTESQNGTYYVLKY